MKKKNEDYAFLEELVQRGGPKESEYEKFTSIVDNLEPSEITRFREDVNPVLNENTLIGHAYVKPYGYPGDFLLIDYIYNFKVNEDERYRNWDLFFQNQAGANAVRNRKDYFVRYCSEISKSRNNPKVLILGSGPGSDVYEFFSTYPNANISFDLIDFDQAAIEFSKERNKVFNDKISYYRINALRYNSLKLYDLIWSAGLFDYFKDKHFNFLVRKYYHCLTEDGEMIISNFSTRNPTKKLMEHLSDWYLNLRTESDLYRIASEANIDKELVSIDKEPLGVNLFLRIKKNHLKKI
ncbi:MAG TPA: class I SAM-dependent methyltransferase [Bacteroidales bacterium]|nr:class I SAM-dependent methyltransferase [Bacteroidales bacterium]